MSALAKSPKDVIVEVRVQRLVDIEAGSYWLVVRVGGESQRLGLESKSGGSRLWRLRSELKDK